MKNFALTSLAVLALSAAAAAAAPAAAQEEAPDKPALGPTDIVNAAPQEDWVVIAPEDMVVMTLAPDAEGNERQVVIQLLPAPFSQGWVENIRKLARAKWYDGISVNRVQDNYVVQWGDPGHDNPEGEGIETKPLPEGLNVMGEEDYTVDRDTLSEADQDDFDSIDFTSSLSKDDLLWVADKALAAVLSSERLSLTEKNAAVTEYRRMTEGIRLVEEPKSATLLTPDEIAMISIRATATQTAPEGWHQRDSQAQWVQFWRGWPIANYEVGEWRDREDNLVPAPNMIISEAEDQGFYFDAGESTFWPVHCYGMVGVGRNYSPDTGSGAELYTVIGHAPRHLDRNIALAGRIISGMEHLSSLPRGSGALGFYTSEEAGKRTPILSIRVASDLPEEERPLYEYLNTETETFQRYAEARANRREPFFIVPAGGADICNIPVPVRAVSNTVSNE